MSLIPTSSAPYTHADGSNPNLTQKANLLLRQS